MRVSLKEFLDSICFNGRRTLQNRSDYDSESFPMMEMISMVRYGYGVFDMLERFLSVYYARFDSFMLDDIEHKCMWRLIYEIREEMVRWYFPSIDRDWDDMDFQMDHMERNTVIEI